MAKKIKKPLDIWLTLYYNIYVRRWKTDGQEEAKEKLEEVTKRLIDEQESDLIEHTNFEEEQEEKSIIIREPRRISLMEKISEFLI